MKICAVVILIGLAISFALVAFAQEKEEINPFPFCANSLGVSYATNTKLSRVGNLGMSSSFILQGMHEAGIEAGKLLSVEVNPIIPVGSMIPERLKSGFTPVSTQIAGANFRANAMSTPESNIPIELLLPSVRSRSSISFMKSLRWTPKADSQDADHSESFIEWPND